jgi:hypothetical protein
MKYIKEQWSAFKKKSKKEVLKKELLEIREGLLTVIVFLYKKEDIDKQIINNIVANLEMQIEKIDRINT